MGIHVLKGFVFVSEVFKRHFLTNLKMDLPLPKKSKMKPTRSKMKPTSSSERGVCYFSHVPHGFFEKEMREFLTQFGTVTNLRIGRSAKTGGSKGYAFVEFMFQDVAKIVAETMNNYLMFEKLIKCQIVPADKVGKAIFKGKINPSKPPRKMARFAAKKALNATRTDEQNENRSKRQAAKLKQIQAKLEKYGVQLAIPEGEKKVRTPKSKTTKSALTTPIMEIDEDDEDIKLKTPPHVRKIKSRPNSAAATPKGSRNNTPINPKTSLAKKTLLDVSSKLKKSKVETPKKIE